jgi:predicted HicB family RNase H-like nuclease
MDYDMHMSIKVTAAKQSRSMNDLMIEAVKTYLQQVNLKDSLTPNDEE